MGKLSDYSIRALKPRAKVYRVADGDGLTLEVRPAPGGRFWRYRFRLDGKPGMAALGEYPACSLAEARQRLTKARELVKAGRNPAHVAQQERAQQIADDQADRERLQAEAAAVMAAAQCQADTLERLARDWITSRRATWSERYAAQVLGYFEREVFPTLGSVPARDVTAPALRALLLAVAAGRRPTSGGERRQSARGAPAAARLLRMWVSSAFAFAIAHDRAELDPTPPASIIATTPRQHSQAFNLSELGTLLRKADAYTTGQRSTVIALHLLAATMVRTGELRAARWAEFELDGDAPLWRIPAERMKTRRIVPEPHLVPLSRQAVALLAELRELQADNSAGWIFPNTRKPADCMSATTLNRVIERLGYSAAAGQRFHAHGFRASASTLLHEAGFTPDVIERALAHKLPGIRGVYSRAQYLPERRTMLQQWADMLDAAKAGATIIPLHRAA